MPAKQQTPGVYIEKNAFPSMAVAVETAIPVFIGYTEKAEWNGKSLIDKPTRITSLAEYVERFGVAFRAKFRLGDNDPTMEQKTFAVGTKQMVLKMNINHTSYLYNSIRLFYANGGGPCYILAVNTYQDKKDGFEITIDDFLGSTTKVDPFELLKNESEPTLVVVPDAIALGEACYSIYAKILAHCAAVQHCFGIFDLAKQLPSDSTSAIVDSFREKIGENNLKYGAAYYPWLKTSIVQPDEVTFENLDASIDLETILPPSEAAAIEVVKKYKANIAPTDIDKFNYHKALMATSTTYNSILAEIRSELNELPPSAAMAGLYAAVDNSSGVWKIPANISVTMVNAPTINISAEQQENLNVDVRTGKSINSIRTFPGVGTLVWGGRTLDGNSQGWRYINVTRTFIMIEQSLKLAARAYVFEPNNSNTWVSVRSMMMNFLTGLWKQGALAGGVPDDAFDVQIGLGSTMTATDLLDGIMRIAVKVAIAHPYEFIEITFEQQMQQS